MDRNIESVLISSAGIKNSLKKYKPLQALAEYVWNGFDAHASRIDITIVSNVLLGTSFIAVSDNGYGIEHASLENKFRPFFQSEKIYDPEIKHSATHGKNGVGRLTFFSFANLAIWETTYRREEKHYSYSIEINESTLENYLPSVEIESNKGTGTTVTFTDLTSTDISIDTAKSYLALEFCWFIELNNDKNYSIYINGELLDYNALILSKETFSYLHEETKTKFDIKYIYWRAKLSEFSKYYYIKSNGAELAKENTTLNNKGDHFYHSVYIQSELFDNFDLTSISMRQDSLGGISHRKSPAFEFIMREVNRQLYDDRRPFIKESVSDVVEKLEIETAFPNFNPHNILDQYRKSQIEELVSAIYIAQPKMFTNSMNKEQKKTFIRLLDLIMESGEVESLFIILNEVLDMDESDRHDLAEILKFANISNVTKTIRLIKDRYQAVSDLKQLVFNRNLKANEVKHLQKFIEQHYWLFGEQYNLVTAAEPNFEQALRRELRFLHKEYEDVKLDHPDKLKQMDIFAVRQDIARNMYNNIVVELKHPDVPLGETQLSQVKKYMNVIMSNEYFNADNMTWEFYLVGNRFANTGYIENELENNKHHGEQNLVFNIKHCKIYVMCWSEIFADFEMRHSYLDKQLQLEQAKFQKDYVSADQILLDQAGSSASMPVEMVHT